MEKTVIELQTALTNWYLNRDDTALRSTLDTLTETKKEISVPELFLSPFFKALLMKNDVEEWKRILDTVANSGIGSIEMREARSLNTDASKYLIDATGGNAKYVAAILLITEIFYGSCSSPTLDYILSLSCLNDVFELLKERLNYTALCNYWSGSSSTQHLVIIKLKLILYKLAANKYPQEPRNYASMTALFVINSFKLLEEPQEVEFLEALSKYAPESFYIDLWKHRFEMNNRLKDFVLCQLKDVPFMTLLNLIPK